MDDISEFLNSVDQSIQQAKRDVDSLKPVLDNIDKTISNLVEVRNKLISSFRQLDDDSVIRKSVEAAVQNINAAKTNTLLENISRAIDLSSEFGNPVFAPYLIQAASNPEALIINFQYSGLSSKIEVDNNMNAVAGSLEDWGRAVLAVRGNSKSSPDQASSSWANLFRSRGNNNLWERIESERGIFSGKLAPFWEILDKGQSGIRLSSDRGGYPTPSEAPTHFIDNTIKELEDGFKRQLSNIKGSITRAKNKLSKKIERADSLLLELESLVNYADDNAGELADNISDEGAVVSTIVTKIVDRYEKTRNSINQNKLQAIITEILETGTLANYSITADGRIEVTATGSSSRARVSLNTILQLIAEG